MTRDDIIRMAQDLIDEDSGCTEEENRYYETTRKSVHELLADFALKFIAAEREACAKLCDAYDVAEDVNSSDTAEGIAIAIRARGQE